MPVRMFLEGGIERTASIGFPIARARRYRIAVLIDPFTDALRQAAELAKCFITFLAACRRLARLRILNDFVTFAFQPIPVPCRGCTGTGETARATTLFWPHPAVFRCARHLWQFWCREWCFSQHRQRPERHRKYQARHQPSGHSRHSRWLGPHLQQCRPLEYLTPPATPFRAPKSTN